MKKKKKKGYSLTAKERKDSRLKQQPNRELTPEEKEALEAKQQKRSRLIKMSLRITAIVLVLAIGLTALGYGITQLVLSKRIDNSKVNPIATIKLSNGKSIEMELLYIENTPKADSEGKITYGTNSDGRAAVANFIYLAKNGFYDGTIFSNTQSGFIAFEGYTAPGVHRAKDENYVAKLKGFSDDKQNVWSSNSFKLGYRLRASTVVSATKKNADGSEYLQAGYMAMIAGSGSFSTSTGFVIVDENPQFIVKDKDMSSLDNFPFKSALSYMARIKDADSLKVMKDITKLDTTQNSQLVNWAYPSNLRIESIKISKLSDKLSKDIMDNFEDFVINKETDIDTAIKGHLAWRTNANPYLPK